PLAEGGAAFARLQVPLRAYALSDDHTFAPGPAVAALFRCYSGASPGELLTKTPADLGVPRIGHFGWLKPSFEATLWTEIADWLLARVDPMPVPRSGTSR